MHTKIQYREASERWENKRSSKLLKRNKRSLKILNSDTGSWKKMQQLLGHLKKHDFQPRFLYSVNPLSIGVEQELLRHTVFPLRKLLRLYSTQQGCRPKRERCEILEKGCSRWGRVKGPPRMPAVQRSWRALIQARAGQKALERRNFPLKNS